MGITKKGWIKRKLNGNGIPYNKGKKGLQVAWNKGLKKEDHQSMRKMGFQEGHDNYSPKGKDSWNWKGGITPEKIAIRNSIEMRLWREAVFARDIWTCQKCNIMGEVLNAHHIHNFNDYKELRFAIDNGVTLCEKCHKKFHSINGKKNNTMEQLKEFFTYTA